MKNMNAKGFTLVECLVAMMVFSVATTGFVMCARASMNAQARAKDRLNQTNQQTTNLETYAGAVDFGAASVTKLDNINDNKYTMVYKFTDSDVITYEGMYGYQSKYTNEDEVLKLGFFSSDDQLPLKDEDRWVIIKNISGADVDWYFETTDYFFFNNEKSQLNPPNKTTGLRADMEDYRFGMTANDTSADWKNALTISVEDEEGNKTSLTIDDLEAYNVGDNIIRLYYKNLDSDESGILTDTEYQDWLASLDE